MAMVLVDTVPVLQVCLGRSHSTITVPDRVGVSHRMDAMDKYVGIKYKLKTSENFEEYLKFIGVGLISRKTACAVTPISVLTRNEDGSYTFTMSTTFRTAQFTFRIGEEFIEERPDGVKIKSLMMVEGDTMIQTQVEDCGRKSTHTRTFTPALLTVVTTADGWDGKCVRVYEAIP